MDTFSLDRVHILEDRSLRLEDVTVQDEGEYSCEADNAVGSISAMGSLTVHCMYFFFVFFSIGIQLIFFFEKLIPHLLFAQRHKQ